MEYHYDNEEHKVRKRKDKFNPNRSQVERAIKKFLKNGGKIYKEDYMPDFHEIVGRFESPSQKNLMELI